jgi:hypothetical protein
MTFEVYQDIESAIRNAIESRIYLGELIESLYTSVKDIPNEANTTEDVLRKYEAFFAILKKEIGERGIEKVVIGKAPDSPVWQRFMTIELTPDGIFTLEDGKKEASKLQDIIGDIYPPQNIIGNVIDAITRQKNKQLIDGLESGINHVWNLFITRCKLMSEGVNDNTIYDVARKEDEQ